MLYVLTFILGSYFGMIVMSLLVCAGKTSREEEKTEEEQDIE